MVTVAVDVMGGDLGPFEVIKGALDAISQKGDLKVILVGCNPLMDEALEKLSGHMAFDTDRVTNVYCQEFVTMDMRASEVVKKNHDFTVIKAAEMVASGEAVGLVSTGNSGATVAAALTRIRNIEGIKRPALAAFMPTKTGNVIVMDVGSKVDCKPQDLFQFALMGETFVKNILGRDRVRIGLLNIGEEEGKGNELARETFDLLRKNMKNFMGNVEANDLFRGKTDVAVCDGFVGNVLLKAVEGIAELAFHLIEKDRKIEEITEETARNTLLECRNLLDASEYGGAPLFGVNGNVIVCHGSSDSRAVKNSVLNAAHFEELKIVERIRQSISQFVQEASI